MPTCMVCGKWIDDGRTKFVGKRCTCKNEYKNADGSTELRFIIKSDERKRCFVCKEITDVGVCKEHPDAKPQCVPFLSKKKGIELVTHFKRPFKQNNVVHKLYTRNNAVTYKNEGYPVCGPDGGYVHNASRMWKDVTCAACLKKKR